VIVTGNGEYRVKGGTMTLLEEYERRRNDLEVLFDEDQLTLLLFLHKNGGASKGELLRHFGPETSILGLLSSLFEGGYVGFISDCQRYFTTPQSLKMLQCVGISIIIHWEDVMRVHEESSRIVRILRSKHVVEALNEMKGQLICSEILFGRQTQSASYFSVPVANRVRHQKLSSNRTVTL
jgi:hypothetical protein